MNNFRIWLNEKYNKYKDIIWIGILIVGLIVLMNKTAKSIKTQRSSSSSNIATTYDTEENYSSGSNVSNSYSSSNQTSNEDSEEEKEHTIIVKFLDYCNSGNIDSAYAMLFDGCKKNLYPTEKEFKKSYINKYFSSNKMYEIFLYSGSTYMVTLKKNAIETGSSDDSSASIDYITIKSDDKISVGGMIQYSEPNKNVNSDYAEVYLTRVYYYMDYDEFEISIKNLTEADISINYSNSNKIYAMYGDEKVYVEQGSYTESQLKISSGETKTYKFRFDKRNVKTAWSTLHFETIRVEI